MIEIATAFARHVLNLFCFLSSFWLEDCGKGEMWKEVWNLLVRNNWRNSRKNEWKEWFFALVKLEKLPRDWIGWMVEIGWNQTKQTTISTTTELDFLLLLLSASERNAVFSRYSNNPTFLEWQFREQKHLKRENGNEMEKYLLLVNRQYRKMILFHNQCYLKWDWEYLMK